VKVLVDTSVWSLALRRAQPAPARIVQEVTELVHEGRVVVIGPIRQELLSGLKGTQQFQTLRDHLRSFPDLELETADFEEAAQVFNRCRAKGIQGANTDFLMCAVASRRDLAIFTTDRDFAEFRRVLPLTLHEPRS
jgi:predicted nucleic acid-binding protein